MAVSAEANHHLMYKSLLPTTYVQKPLVYNTPIVKPVVYNTPVVQPLVYKQAVPVVAPKYQAHSAGVSHTVLKREAEADPQLLVGAVPAAVPYHNCVNKVTEVCYPVQKVEPTTVTEKS